MTYIITGKVISASHDYFDCIDFSKFSVNIYGVGFGSLTQLKTINVSSDGTFSTDLDSNAPAIVAKLIYLGSVEQSVIAQSERFCRQDKIDITFAVDMSQLGGNIFSRILSMLAELGIPRSTDNIISWTADQLSELSCITCLSIKTLKRFQTAHRLHKEFKAFNSSLYSETSGAANAIKNGPDIFIPAFFALTGNDFALSVADLLTHSRIRFLSLLQKAGEKNEIPAGMNSRANADALVGSRNALLLNALDNGNYYDAKIIHLAPISYIEKSSLLDNALDGGSLQSIIAPDSPLVTTTIPIGSLGDQLSDFQFENVYGPIGGLQSPLLSDFYLGNINLPIVGGTLAGNSAALKKTIPIITLNAHLQHFAPLLQIAIKNANIGTNPDYYSITLLGVELWKNMEGPVSPRFSNKDEYANAIYNSLSAGQPTARLSRNLNGSGLENAAVMKAVLDAHRNFNIEEHSVSSFFTTEEGQPNYIPADVATRLQTLQRSVKLTGDSTDLKATKALLDTNLTSAHAITQKGENAFIQVMASKGIAREVSAAIYCKSVAMASTVNMLATQYLRYEREGALMPSSLVKPVYNEQRGALLNLPDMETLFGSFNTCACSHCQSVYSPAAYLTDLLHWLNGSVCDTGNTGKTGFDALMSMTRGSVAYDRRKDIKYLNLNCRNTNTLLPYIDIVNELLAVNLLPAAGGYPPRTSIDDYKLLQTIKTTEEIMVQPDHRFPASEALLKTSFFPWMLPYDAGFDEATVYLQELKTPYASLINDFSNQTDQYNTFAWAYAFLLLSPSEAGLINSSKVSEANFWKKYWGFAPTQLLDTAAAPATPKVGPVLKNADITLDELKDVLTARYINGATRITIVPFAGDACDVDKYTFSPKFTIAIADRFMRFLRLKRKTGLTTQELDLAIVNHGSANGIDATFLLKLASCKAFAQKYALSFTDVQTLINANAYSDVSLPATRSSYYKNKLQNPLLPADVIAYFTPGSTTQVFLTNVANITNAGKQKLSTVFKVSIPEIEAIIAVAFNANPVLSLGNLSVIDRYSTLIRIFAIEPSELKNTLFLLGDPFNTATYPDTMKALWNFSEKIKDLNRLSVTATELRNILEGTGKYALTATELNAAAESVWNDVELAYTKSRLANPAKLFAASAPYLPVVAADEAFFSNVIIENIRLPFKLSSDDTRDIINNYAATWLKDYVANPEGAGSPRGWANRKAAFLPVYRLLNRIALLADITELQQDGLRKGVDEKIRGLASYPGDHFYWMTNTFSPANYTDVVWIKNITARAAESGMSQSGYLNVIQDYQANHATTYSASNDTKIVDFYNLMDESSRYKSLSVFEFTQTFLRAKAIADPVADLEAVMQRVDAIFRATDVLNIKVTDAWSWVWNTAWTARVDVSAFNQDIRRVLNAGYPVFADWSEFIVPIQNGFRSRLRDAFVAYYIGNKDFADENALYAYYLLDTQMAPCMKTSRIVAATGSAQLLVHRALLGLEPAVCMDADDKQEWEWRKNYRVWEANRKVFLYPENWIDPSLRTNKTALFEDAEGLLQQDEINQENSEKAFAGYLTGLNEVAHLDVRATYIEALPLSPLPNAGTREVLHVFARTWNPPYTYFYRNRTASVWSPWEKMGLEIDSDHLIPVVFNRKLYVFFPLFVERQHQSIKRWIDGESVNAPYLEIKMCYSKLDFGKWQNKKIVNGTLQCGPIASPNIPNTERGLVTKLGFMYTGNENQTVPITKGEIYGENLVWNNDYLKNYVYVSLKREGFYFWPSIDTATGDLNIYLRRNIDEFFDNWHAGYSEMTSDWGFRIGACDEKTEIVPPDITATGSTDKGFIARPYMTLPFFQQMKRGRDDEGFDPNNPGADAGLWVKDTISHAGASTSTTYLKKTNGDFVLTYPQQYKDNLRPQPFFYSDKKHSFFVSYPKNAIEATVTLSEHPLTCKMLEALNRFGIEGLLNSPNSPGLKRQDFSEPFFITEYSPTENISTPYPIQDFDFSSAGQYSIYNWEVFFHSVSLIARQLRQNNQFDDAAKWLSYIFDPANRDVNLLDLRYWKVKPFLMEVKKGIAYYIRLLSASNLTAAEQQEKADYNAQIEQWRDHPFDPHLIAGMRPRAYMLWTVMELVDTLTDWGDFLFRQDTMESINEALNLYIVASEILGARPKRVDRPAPPERNFDSIMNGLSAFSNVAVNFENHLTGLNICNGERRPASGLTGHCRKAPALTVLPDLLFCIPDNPRLTEMWDRVEDRLYKIRHCMNIDGKVRELALFSPPIDPAMLVRATALGLDLGDVLSDLAAAPPHYRFSYLLQRANDFCNDVKSLGAQLLTALEKKDAEELSLFRQVHEQNILKASRSVKQLQIDEAKQNYATLQYSKNLIQIRLNDYSKRQYKNNREDNAIKQTGIAEGFMYAEQGVRLAAGFINLIPDPETGFSGLGPYAVAKLPGGQKIASLMNAGANALSIVSSVMRNKATMSITYASYDRRQEDWNLQIKMAEEELVQVDRQLLSAEIRIAVTEKELENHDLQAEQSAEVYDWLKNKYTNAKLYTWMAGELKTLHRKSYELAYEMAKLAQQAFYKDLGDDAGSAKISFGHWDSGRAGFFAGERLGLQLKELERFYMQRNTRNYELSKHISLAQLDPFALEQLKATGICDIVLPEVLFDMDHPNHYYRRIRSVSLTIPGITGPYTSINATLTLINHKTRKSSLNLATLAVESGFGESIATSSAQNDSGVFELNFRDERYMPFEGKGAVSTWRLEFPDIVRQFNFSTIADVVMHMQYTAKDGGTALADRTKEAFINNINALSLPYKTGFYYAVNLRHDMPDAWHLLKKNGTVNITIAKNRLPYFAQGLNPVIDVTTPAASNVVVLAESNASPGTNFKVATATAGFNQTLTTDYFKADFGLVPGLMLDTPIKLTSNLAAGNDFSDLIVIVKIKVS